ncbi:hypothetical protein ASJ81_16990 [Methanosarcina spelaei]|uniref:Uncharacterized protein n=1 Tax=Methanosarcina spelaei TaxID=1036679 RepID=A0A2A2HWM4_9EURY|nr:hypothetical protein ASJ81_16990 [Methanosarcina spelaei]
MRYYLLDYVEYISVREFQKNGKIHFKIHFHLTSFCLNWLMHKSAIQYVEKRGVKFSIFILFGAGFCPGIGPAGGPKKQQRLHLMIISENILKKA